MKKFLTMAFAVLAVGLFASCNSNTDDTYNIVGTWEIKKITMGDSTGPKETQVIPDGTHAYFIFNADGNVYQKAQVGTKEETTPKGKWSLADDVITLNDGEPSYMKIMKYTNSELVLRQTFTDDDEYQEYEMTRV